jgi:hypothetical protein
LKERDQSRIGIEHFADYTEGRIGALDGAGPVAPELARHTLQSVLANAMDAGAANPPR